MAAPTVTSDPVSEQRLVTQCPHCSTLFRISSEQLRAARGKARCSCCGEVFNALEGLREGAALGERERAIRSRDQTRPSPRRERAPRARPAAEGPDQAAAGSTGELFANHDPHQPALSGEPAGPPAEIGAEATAEAEDWHPLESDPDEVARLEARIESIYERTLHLPHTPYEGDEETEPRDGLDADESGIRERPVFFDLSESGDAEPDPMVLIDRTPTGEHSAAAFFDLGPAEEETDEYPGQETEEVVLQPIDSGFFEFDEPVLEERIQDYEPELAPRELLARDAEVGGEIPEEAAAANGALMGEPAPAPLDAEPPPEEWLATQDQGGLATDFQAPEAPPATRGLGPRRAAVPNDLLAELEGAVEPPARRPLRALKGAAALLALTLAAQGAYFYRAELTTLPLLGEACRMIGCALPARRDLRRIEVLNRDVRPHPQTEQALLVSLTLVNRAAFAQPFPTLEMSFSDTDGRLVALRRFAPAEYRPTEAASMTPGEPVPLRLELRDPGARGVSFRFRFF